MQICYIKERREGGGGNLAKAAAPGLRVWTVGLLRRMERGRGVRRDASDSWRGARKTAAWNANTTEPLGTLVWRAHIIAGYSLARG